MSVEWRKFDRYGRVIGKVILNGVDINLMQVSAGLAWHYKAYAKEQAPKDRRLYAEAQARAERAKAGLWVDPHPVPPWGFRRTGRRQ